MVEDDEDLVTNKVEMGATDMKLDSKKGKLEDSSSKTVTRSKRGGGKGKKTVESAANGKGSSGAKGSRKGAGGQVVGHDEVVGEVQVGGVAEVGGEEGVDGARSDGRGVGAVEGNILGKDGMGYKAGEVALGMVLGKCNWIFL